MLLFSSFSSLYGVFSKHKYLEGCFPGSKPRTDGTNGTDHQGLEGTLGTTSKRDLCCKNEDANERRAWGLKLGFLLRLSSVLWAVGA